MTLWAVILLGFVSMVLAQFTLNSALYNESVHARTQELTQLLQNAPRLEDIYYPAKYRLPTDFYVLSEAGGRYVQNVIFDPCRQYGFACCNDTFGTPEYQSRGTYLPEGEDIPRHRPLRDDGSEMAQEISRRPDDELVHDAVCTGALHRLYVSMRLLTVRCGSGFCIATIKDAD